VYIDTKEKGSFLVIVSTIEAIPTIVSCPAGAIGRDQIDVQRKVARFCIRWGKPMPAIGFPLSGNCRNLQKLPAIRKTCTQVILISSRKHAAKTNYGMLGGEKTHWQQWKNV
jgi:hypothetical protein